MTPGPVETQAKASLAVQPVHTLVVDLPALAPEQFMYASIAVTYTGGGDLADPLHQRSLILGLTAVVKHRARQGEDATGLPCTGTELFDQALGQLPPLARRAQSFFDRTS